VAALIRIDRQWTSPDSDGATPIRFCSRCGEPSNQPPKAHANLIRDRVCIQCGMGLMLSCTRDAMPGPAAIFMVFTYELTVSAVSESAERIFGLEQDLLGLRVEDVLMSPAGQAQLVAHVGRASQRACEPVVLPVRGVAPETDTAGMMAARISTCGPPRAALVTMEPSHFGRR
jgi:hypothetical protein